MLKINYFASVRERVNSSSETLALPPGVSTAGDLADYLAARGPEWSMLQSRAEVLIAVNQAVCSPDQRLDANDEIAFFPPMTGG